MKYFSYEVQLHASLNQMTAVPVLNFVYMLCTLNVKVNIAGIAWPPGQRLTGRDNSKKQKHFQELPLKIKAPRTHDRGLLPTAFKVFPT